MLWQLIVFFICISNVIGNYYETLSVSRSATDYDIKKSYKKLARIWHPDKSKSPDANERFMKINEAYEVLSDPEKRKEYDAFGSVSNEPKGHNGFHGNHFWSSNFGNAFFHSEEDAKETPFETIDYRIYKMDIIPESNTKPTLLLLVTHFCMPCHHAMRLWNTIATQVTDSGIKIGISDVMRDSRLREELKIHHVPSVVFIINGQVKYMQPDINKETVIEFLRQSFPRTLVNIIYSEDDLNKFHDLWMKDSRSRMIMTKPLERASFRYLSLAFKYRDKITAGFINLDDNRNDQLKNIVNAYSLDYDEETLLIFNDEKQNYDRHILPKPVAKLSQSRLSLSEMDYLIDANHQLPLPRLLSQSVFDRSCPPPSQKQRSYGFCVIAIVHSKHGKNLSEAENWQYLRSLVDDRSRSKMLYLFGDIQLEFLRSLQLFDQATSNSDAFINQVILLWRQSYDSAASIFLSNPWEYPNLDWVMRNWNLLSNLDTAVPMLNTKNRIQTKLADSESLSELVDELAAPLIWRIWDRFLYYVQQIGIFCYEYIFDPFTLIIIIMAFILLSYSYTTIKAVSKHISEEDRNRSKVPQPNMSSKGPEIKTFVRELTPDSYEVLINSNQPGKLVIVMLITDLTLVDPVKIMINSVAKLKCKNPIEPTVLRLDLHINWLKSLLSNISDPLDKKNALSIISSLSINRPNPEEGIVLILNISRNYLLICPINMLCKSPFPYLNHDSDEMKLKKRSLRNTTYYIDSDISDSDASSIANDKTYVEKTFFDWLCQFMEGTCRRFYLSRWPVQL